jgi:DNA-binding beta-propeller fold protein YncE
MKKSKILLSGLLLTTILWSCRKDQGIIPEEQTKVPEQITAVNGLYLLNEGNYGSNKASLDYYDYATGVYRKNIYGQANPSVTLGLGDVGNDIQIYGSKLYVVVNGSNKIEILDKKTTKKVGQIDVPNCRYITFYKDKAYVTAYAGYVAVIDTVSFTINTKINVGQQPEEMAVVGDKLYVANSGGYNAPNYERTVSVIDLINNKELKRIDVEVNLHNLKADQYGDIYVTTRGDYGNIASNLYVLDTKTDAVKKKFNVAASEIFIDKDFAYIYSVQWNNATNSNKISFSKINVKDETLLVGGFITDGTEKDIVLPYGIAVDPLSSDIYVTDAKDYTTPGKLYCYDKSGKKKFSVTTGDVPAHIVFYTK